VRQVTKRRERDPRSEKKQPRLLAAARDSPTAQTLSGSESAAEERERISAAFPEGSALAVKCLLHVDLDDSPSPARPEQTQPVDHRRVRRRDGGDGASRLGKRLRERLAEPDDVSLIR
jgi:hypothetical protein